VLKALKAQHEATQEAAPAWVAVEDSIWGKMKAGSEKGAVPDGQIRNESISDIRLSYRFWLTDTGKEKLVQVQVFAASPSPSFNKVYFLVEEKVKSGKVLRSYFDISMNASLHFVPSRFFEKERDCARRTKEAMDEVFITAERGPDWRSYAMPHHVPGNLRGLQETITRLQSIDPALIVRAKRIAAGTYRRSKAPTRRRQRKSRGSHRKNVRR
jgi:hypothetical protein